MKKQSIKKKEVVTKQSESTPQSSITDVESRRIFLRKLWKGLGVIASIEVAAVLFGFLFTGKDEKENEKPKQLFDAGEAKSFKPDSVTVFRGGRFYLVRLADGGFLALSLRCTHLGCSVEWEEDKERFVCPCHASAFEINGNVLNPPAPSALDYFPVKIQSGRVMVDVGTKMSRTRFSKTQVAYS